MKIFFVETCFQHVLQYGESKNAAKQSQVSRLRQLANFMLLIFYRTNFHYILRHWVSSGGILVPGMRFPKKLLMYFAY